MHPVNNHMTLTPSINWIHSFNTIWIHFACRFCPSVFLYLTAVVPGLWLLQFDLYHKREDTRESNGWEECVNEIFNATGLSEIQGVSFYHSFHLMSKLPSRTGVKKPKSETWANKPINTSALRRMWNQLMHVIQIANYSIFDYIFVISSVKVFYTNLHFYYFLLYHFLFPSGLNSNRISRRRMGPCSRAGHAVLSHYWPMASTQRSPHSRPAFAVASWIHRHGTWYHGILHRRTQGTSRHM